MYCYCEHKDAEDARLAFSNAEEAAATHLELDTENASLATQSAMTALEKTEALTALEKTKSTAYLKITLNPVMVLSRIIALSLRKMTMKQTTQTRVDQPLLQM